MIFALWDTETGNIVGTWEREADALALVRAAVRAYGPAYADTLALVREDARGEVTPIAAGAALAARAAAANPVPAA